MKSLSIKIILFLTLSVLAFTAGFMVGPGGRAINTTVRDTVVQVMDPDTVYMPAQIRYIHTTDTLLKIVEVDSVARIDTVFRDSGKLKVNYYYNDRIFEIYRTPPPVKTITNTIYPGPESWKWYDGIGVSLGYDIAGKQLVMTVGYSFNIANAKGLRR